jgi:hypothetical protein
MAETSQKPPFPVIREAVAAFADKAALRRAVAALLAAGFKSTDLSLLTDHDSLEVAGDLPGYPAEPGQSLLAGLTDQVAFLSPLTVAGIVLLSGGPVAVALGALVAAGLGGVALKEVLDRFIANEHSEEFADALAAGGVLLWVRIADPEREAAALRILAEAGGANAHVNARTPGSRS